MAHRINNRTSMFPILGVMLSVFLMHACESGSTSPRLPGYLGPSFQEASTSGRVLPREPDAPFEVGISIVSDDSLHGSAPRLSEGMLVIIQNRIVQQLEEDLGLTVVGTFPPKGLDPQEDVLDILSRVHERDIPFWLVTIFSSSEIESPSQLGEETLMTRMPGTEVENFSRVEVALVDVPNKRIIFQAMAEASEVMEQLALPFGEKTYSQQEARDILRANSAMKAWDRAYPKFKRQTQQP